jgi:hypothetical protein
MTLRTGKGGRYRYYTCSSKRVRARPAARAAPCRWRSWTISDTARGYLIDIGGNLNQGAPRATLLEDAPVSFSCLLHKKADGEVIAMNLDTRQQIVLPPGRWQKSGMHDL